MTPVALIRSALSEGVQLRVTRDGTLKVGGPRAAVARWQTALRLQKEAIVKTLQGTAVDHAWLEPFRFDLVEHDIAAGYPAHEIDRVNNMAWEFMKAERMTFTEAIRAAAAIVASCEVAACEAAYEDVRALWHRLRCAT